MQLIRRTSFARLSQKDLSAAVARHEMLYSGRMGGARAVFAFCDLSGLDLSGRQLSDADFTGAVLEEANLAGARLGQLDLLHCQRLPELLEHGGANLHLSPPRGKNAL